MSGLPDEIVDLILQHRAAMSIQRRWLRFSHYGHARRAAWCVVRRHLQLLGAWPHLFVYPKIRREWRSECESWLETDKVMAHTISIEAHHGMWGRPTAQFKQIEQRAVPRQMPHFPQRLLRP